MLKITKRLVIAVFCMCLALGANAQDKKITKKEENKIHLVYIDKDGKKHELKESYTGEMPESLKKKMAKFKAEMKKNGGEMHFGNTGDNEFFFDSKDGAGNIKIITVDEKGQKKVIIEHVDGKISEEVKEKLSKLKEEEIVIDIDTEGTEIIELDGLHEEHSIKGGHVIVKKNGKVVLDEKFEGKMPVEIKKKLEELKKEEGDIQIDVSIDADENADNKHKKHRIRKIKMHEGEGAKDKVIEIKVEGDEGNKGQHKVWIMKDGKTIESSEEGAFHYKIEVDEDVESDGKTKIEKVFVFTVIRIEDIKEDDKDIPNEFRFSKEASLEESISDLNFYPNPNNGQFKLNFNLSDKGNTGVSIFDLNGKEIYNEQLNDFSGSYSKDLNLQSQPKGVYILKITQGDKMLSKKLVIQ